MISNKPENLSPDGESTQFSNIVNGQTIVKFQDLKNFILIERESTLSGLARLMGYSRYTFSNTLDRRGKQPSCILILHRLEKHFGVIIEGDPYRR